jgi:hypothetical protein
MAISANFSTTQPSLLLDFANTTTLDPRVTFTRSVPATYYDNHTSTLAEQNLFLYSQDFTNNYWKAFSAVTATGNAIAAPDGTVTATQIAANLAASNNGSFENTIGAPVGSTITVYAKAGNVNYLAIGSANSNAWASFNLSTGATGNSFACTTSIVSVGSGWYRCVMANITSALTRVMFAMKSTDVTGDPWSNGTVAIGDYIYVWGAQLEQRTAPTAYNLTTTSQVVNYIPTLQTAAINVPRFDYDPVTRQAVGLMVEQQSTNLTTQSQTFSTGWTTTQLTAINNTVIAPNGTLTGTNIIPAAVSNIHGIQFTPNLGSGTFTYSVYAKAAGYPRLGLRVYDGTAYQIRVTFDLSNGTVVLLEAGTATITSVGNGWYRCTGTGVSASGTMGATAGWVIESLPAGVTVQTVFTGDGYSGAYIWGAQIEALPFASSYIATTTASTVRTADLAVMTGTNFSSWFNSGQGTFYTDSNSDILNAYIARLTYNVGSKTTFALTTDSNYISTIVTTTVNVRGNNSYTVGQFIYTGGGTDFGGSIQNTILIPTNIDKIATYINNPAQLYAISAVGQISAVTTNGGRPGGNSYANANMMNIGYNSGYQAAFSGHIKKLAFYPAQLTNAQIQNLTL